jgi:KDO2-lipid IV(A) lauroyltransferase
MYKKPSKYPSIFLPRKINIGRLCLYFIEFFFAVLLTVMVFILPYKIAIGFIGGFLKKIGVYLPSNKRAIKNLKATFPHKTDVDCAEISKGVWHIVDYVKLPLLKNNKNFYTIEGLDILKKIQQEGRATIFFSAHSATWEIARLAARDNNVPMSIIYRAFNNPFIDYFIWRFMYAPTDYIFHKGNQGVKKMLKCLKSGNHVMILVDQRLRRGLNIPFLGRDAKTAPSVAELALKHDYNLVPVIVQRQGAGKFHIRFEEKLSIIDTKGQKKSVATLLHEVNQKVEHWVLERPKEWFWLHKRWD